ncbi:MAG: hypothetical protein LBH92_01020 [Bacteroidales bacterium]|jgi:hypothetical protein|nr:hypothetical protein [Bacteroidales bacterium]
MKKLKFLLAFVALIMISTVSSGQTPPNEGSFYLWDYTEFLTSSGAPVTINVTWYGANNSVYTDTYHTTAANMSGFFIDFSFLSSVNTFPFKKICIDIYYPSEIHRGVYYGTITQASRFNEPQNWTVFLRPSN